MSGRRINKRISDLIRVGGEGGFVNTKKLRGINVLVGYILLVAPFFAVSYEAWQMGGAVRHDLVYCLVLLSIGASLKRWAPSVEAGGLVTFFGVVCGFSLLHEVGGWPKVAFWVISVAVIIVDILIKKVGSGNPSPNGVNPCGEIM